uniref:Uncharacterized protein n=1 Tax=Macaca mulatta TaxID=9544 RepID=A0A5F7ZHG7_MACMU
DQLKSFSIFTYIHLIRDRGYSPLYPLLETRQCTCIELEKYLENEGRSITETFTESLVCFPHHSPPPCLGETGFHRVDQLSLPLQPICCQKTKAVIIMINRDHLLSLLCMSLRPLSSSKDSLVAVNQASLTDITSLTPSTAPVLSRHLIRVMQYLSAKGNTVTLKRMAKKAPLSSIKI